MSDSRFQRVGASSNAHAGSEFEATAQHFFAARGIPLESNFFVLVGHGRKRGHRFDLGSADPPILVECKSCTWTSGGNVPSAKIRSFNEAMLYFAVSPPEFRKMLVLLRHVRRSESLGAYYVRTQGHLIPPGVEVWEIDPEMDTGQCLLATG